MEHQAKSSNSGAAWLSLGQYSNTAGTIGHLISDYLQAQEDVHIPAERICVTNGFQEALVLQLLELAREGGAVLAIDPTYIGLSGAAMVAGVPIFAAPSELTIADALTQAASAARAAGYQKVSAYLIPDFSNPSGVQLSLSDRIRALEVAEDLDITILEDTAYRLFRYEASPIPSLLSLDQQGRVVYLGSFSKIFMPGVRMGFCAKRVTRVGRGLSKVVGLKSFLSVATSPVTQAIVGGFLLDVQFEVAKWNTQRIQFCRTNRDAVQTALMENFSDFPEVKWRRPEGGFFTSLKLPIPFGRRDLIEAAQCYGAIVTPMSFFSLTRNHRYEVRLAFSNLTSEKIHEGIKRFAQFVKKRSLGARPRKANMCVGPSRLLKN